MRFFSRNLERSTWLWTSRRPRGVMALHPIASQNHDLLLCEVNSIYMSNNSKLESACYYTNPRIRDSAALPLR